MTEDGIRDFRRNLRALERQIELALIAQTECCGVSPAQCHVLLETEAAGEASVGELATSLDLDASTLSRTVDGLVKAGLIVRREDPENRRRQLVGLSPAGSLKVGIINSLCDQYYQGLLGALPEAEAAGFLKALPLFVQALKAWRAEGGEGACCGATTEALP